MRRERKGGRSRRKGTKEGEGEEKGEEGEKEIGSDRREREGRESKEKDKEGKEEERGLWRVAFWNVAGIKNKDSGFWKKLKEWEVIVLMETWLEEKGWEKIKGTLPKEFNWEIQFAKRKNRKGRACGGMLLGIKKGIIRERERKEEEEGRIECIVKIEKEKWRIVGVYVNEDLEEKLEGLKDWMEERDEGIKTIIGGDFNARTGEEGGWREGEDGGKRGGAKNRKSKDKKVNGEGRKLLQAIEENGWIILNGSVRGDEEGEFTYTGGRGETVIDYVIGGREILDKVEGLEIGEEVDSDHHPVVVSMRGRIRKDKKGERRMIRRGRWDEEGREAFKREIGRIQGGKGGIEEEIEEKKMRIKEGIKKSEEGREDGRRKRRGWWDEECMEEKRMVRRELRSWRQKVTENKNKYRERKRRYKELCEKKKKEEKERIEREIGEAKTERKVWEWVNLERRRRKGINEEIKMEDWKEHFMGVLGGVEEKVVKGWRRREEGGETELEEEEIKKVLNRLKDGKAMGKDELPNEVWKYGGEEIEKWAGEVCKRVWRGEGWPEEWKEGIIIPIIKKGKGESAKDYRGVTLMPSLYKVYAAVLEERLREEVEGRGLLSGSQAGFRKGMGTMDQVYALNYLINRQLARKGGKMVAVFIDMKAAFDSVDRGKLIEAMRKRGIREGLVERVEEMLGETKSKVRVREKEGEEFWTAKGVRQGCPLSPILFNILLADMEEELAKGRWGGVKVKGEKVYTLAYADDVVIMAEEEQEMRSVLARLERYMDEKGLVLNVEKTKVMRFKKGGGRRKEVDWRWKGRKLEEVKEFKYLGYTIQKNGRQDEHIRERKRKAAVVMREVWGIGKRVWGKDWRRRLWLFDTLVWTVMGYGAEVWGWKERKEIEGVQDRFLKWTMGVDWRTPGYMIREEVGRELLRGRAGKRAWNFEKRLEEGKGGEVARKCWEEMKERWRRGRIVGEWEQEREEFRRGRGIGEEAEEEYGEIEKRDKEKQKEERWEKINESRYNKWYKYVKGEGIPSYLEKGWAEERWRRVIRYRMGNEMREGQYWEKEEKRKCRVCENKLETWEHVWEECGRGKEWREEGWQEAVERILGEEGEGEAWMREMEGFREERWEGKGEDGTSE